LGILRAGGNMMAFNLEKEILLGVLEKEG